MYTEKELFNNELIMKISLAPYNMAMPKTLNLLPFNSDKKIHFSSEALNKNELITADHICKLLPEVFDNTAGVEISNLYNEYSDIVLTGVGLDDFAVITMSCIGNKMLKRKSFELNIDEKEIFEFHQISEKEQYKWKDRVLISLVRISNTSVVYKDKEGIVKLRSLVDSFDYDPRTGFYKINISRSYFDMFIDTAMVSNINVKAYKLIRSDFARALYRILLNFQYSEAGYILSEADIVNTLNIGGRETRERNQIIKRAFDELVSSGYISGFKIYKVGRIKHYQYTITNKLKEISSAENNKDKQQNQVVIYSYEESKELISSKKEESMQIIEGECEIVSDTIDVQMDKAIADFELVYSDVWDDEVNIVARKPNIQHKTKVFYDNWTDNSAFN